MAQLACRCTTAFGSPVVPLEYCQKDMSSAAVGSGESSSEAAEISSANDSEPGGRGAAPPDDATTTWRRWRRPAQACRTRPSTLSWTTSTDARLSSSMYA